MFQIRNRAAANAAPVESRENDERLGRAASLRRG
jgi:hypothetical protein